MVRIICLILLSWFLTVPLKANAAERVFLVTGRTLYVTGEAIEFSAFVSDDLLKSKSIDEAEPLLSKVLYVEVISPDGESISRGKFILKRQKSEGALPIPDEAVTGYYYLRAYTKAMRNAGPATYTFLLVRIVNPYKDEVLPGTGKPLRIDSTQTAGGSNYTVSLNKRSFNAGEPVEFTLQPEAGNHADLVALTVVPELTFNALQYFKPLAVDSTTYGFHCRENAGLSISGVMRDETSGTVVAEKDINLSVIGKGQDFISGKTDDAGRFNFALPAITGERDLYLSPEITRGSHIRVLIDNDFCNIRVKLPAPAFSLSEKEKAVVLKLAANATISNTYNTTGKQVNMHGTPIDNSPFYGTPDQVLLLEKYIQLPTLEEYFNEIPALAKVRKSGGKKIIRVMGLQPEMGTYAPLVLIDQVAVNEPDRILAASPSNVERIEIINRPYLKGDKLYGGLVSIISRKGDFAGIDLPASGTFINYRFFNPGIAGSFTPDPATPDARNTLFFKSYTQPAGNEPAVYSFITPETPGVYEIIVVSPGPDGEMSVSRRAFEVVSFE
ncbi:MAG TPA: MG2 domain-containing protein [Bacteroidales bacterium]|nr:MG2 domain-containing protein [Bacteroidales bacterium]